MLQYLYARLIKKLNGKAIKGCTIHKKSKIEAGTVAINTTMGRYSYCGYDCLLCNCDIGAFCSISENVSIGGGNHPQNWVSTSPAFYKGRDSIDKKLATLEFDTEDQRTQIQNDVWIGRGAYIKPGITIGTGAIIGMGSVVTKDVPPYTIVAGNPAKEIRKRFDDPMCDALLKSAWWGFSDEKLKELFVHANNPDKFLETVSVEVK